MEVDKIITEITAGVLAPAGATPVNVKSSVAAAAAPVAPVSEQPYYIMCTTCCDVFVVLVGNRLRPLQVQKKNPLMPKHKTYYVDFNLCKYHILSDKF